MSENKTRTRKFNGSTYAPVTIKGVNLAGKTFLITGTTSGIGIETARSLAFNGAHVVMLNRNVAESEKLKKKIVEEMYDAEIDIIECDLNSLASVKRAADVFIEKHWPIHCLILNAGVFGTASKTTLDGLESHFGINHLAHFLLIQELLPIIRNSTPSRIILVSSSVHASCGVTPEMSIDQKIKVLCPESPLDASWFRLYSRSKMCNMLIAFKLHRDEYINGISTYSVHPGNGVRTSIFRDSWLVSFASILSTPFTKNISQGASTTVYCAGHPEVANVSGKYWESNWDDEKNLYKEVARDEELQDALWKHSESILMKYLDDRKNSCLFEC
ncbi:hypothetical protein L5515_013848 [Caenorhabditis briggsae]|uniref:Uncharacterized protein n=1 Tax=Caenorhabditis briggsae TaxID=6238 RepID=A0AAE9J7L5_CAEBR|nr:hypothetical protein L5515_013848 [Caenorhabditis briggsae]